MSCYPAEKAVRRQGCGEGPMRSGGIWMAGSGTSNGSGPGSEMTVPRIGLLFPDRDPTSPENWSGTPSGLAEGLTTCGARVVPIGLRLAPPIRYAAALTSRTGGRRGTMAHRAPAYVAVRSAALAREVRRHRRLTALIAMGTDMYRLSRVIDGRTPVATYDDGTFALFGTHPDAELTRLGYPR